MPITMPPGGPSANTATAIGLENTEGTGQAEEKKTGRGQNGGSFELPPGPVIDRRGSFRRETRPEDAKGQEADLNAASSKLATDTELKDRLMSILNSGGGAEEIAALLIKLSNMNRENVLDQRLQARSAARSDLEGAAAEMKESAAKQIAAAVVSAVMAVVSLAVTAYSAGKSIKSSVDSIGATKEANQTQKMASIAKESGDVEAPKLRETYKNQQADAQNLTLKAQNWTNMGSAASKLGDATGNLIGGVLQADAKTDDAEGKLREASATDQQAPGDVTK